MEVVKKTSLTGHQNPIYALEPSQKPGIFFTAGNDKGVVEWSSRELSFIKVLMPVSSSVYSLHCPDFAPVLAVAERSGKVSLFNFDEQKITAVFNHHKLPVFALNSVPHKKELLAASEDGTVSVVDLLTFNSLYNFKVSSQTIRCVAISPDQRLVAFGCKDNMIYIYNIDDYSYVTQLAGHTHPVTSLEFSPDGKHLLSGGRDAKLNIWDCGNFSLKESIVAHMFAVYDIKFHPTLPYFATSSQDKSIKIWDATGFKLRKIISREKGMQSHSHSINKLAWDKESGALISVSDDKNVMVWEISF